MKYSRYSWSFAAAIVVLTVAALASFREISALSLGDRTAGDERWPDDTLAAAAASPSASYAAVAAGDEQWRRENARPWSLAELRVRGDGRRTPRQAMQDRTFSLTRAGNRSAAIRELERWVASHPRDSDALLWLARLLNDAGRSKESIRRYRQALSAAGGR
jgi:tetratricopeptide (TPR) repeat protein